MNNCLDCISCEMTKPHPTCNKIQGKIENTEQADYCLGFEERIPAVFRDQSEKPQGPQNVDIFPDKVFDKDFSILWYTILICFSFALGFMLGTSI